MEVGRHNPVCIRRLIFPITNRFKHCVYDGLHVLRRPADNVVVEGKAIHDQVRKLLGGREDLPLAFLFRFGQPRIPDHRSIHFARDECRAALGRFHVDCLEVFHLQARLLEQGAEEEFARQTALHRDVLSLKIRDGFDRGPRDDSVGAG